MLIPPNFPVNLINNNFTQDNPLHIENYILNGKPFSAMYWIASNQRIMRSVHLAHLPQVAGWSKAKPISPPAQIVVMAYYPDLNAADPHTLTNSKLNASEPVIFAPIDLTKVPNDPEAIAQLKAYLKLNPEQCAIVDAYFTRQNEPKQNEPKQNEPDPDANAGTEFDLNLNTAGPQFDPFGKPKRTRAPRKLSPEQQELLTIKLTRERVKLEREQAKLEQERTELALKQARLAKIQQQPTAEEKVAQSRAKQIEAMKAKGRKQKPLSREEVELLHDIAWEDATQLPGKLTPFDLFGKGVHAGMLAQRCLGERDNRTRLEIVQAMWEGRQPSVDQTPEEFEAERQRALAFAMRTDEMTAQDNARFYEAEKVRREKGEPVPYRPQPDFSHLMS